MATKPRNTVTINPLGPATERQKALMEALSIPFAPSCTKKEAETLLEASKPWGPKPQGDNKPAKRRAIYRARHVRGYLTRAELAANIAKITEEVRTQLLGDFLEDAPKFYNALKRLRDFKEPDFRAVAYGLDRIMGKLKEQLEHGGKVELTVKYDSAIPNGPPSDSAR